MLLTTSFVLNFLETAVAVNVEEKPGEAQPARPRDQLKELASSRPHEEAAEVAAGGAATAKPAL